MASTKTAALTGYFDGLQIDPGAAETVLSNGYAV
jgi:hypothetical protein